MNVITIPIFPKRIPIKSTVITVGLTALLFGFVIRFLRRAKLKSLIGNDTRDSKNYGGNRAAKTASWKLQNGDYPHLRTSSSPGLRMRKIRNGSVSLSSDMYSSSSTLNTVIEGTSTMTPQQLGLMGLYGQDDLVDVLWTIIILVEFLLIPFIDAYNRIFKIIISRGMEALEAAINYWEDAIAAYSHHTATGALAIPSTEEARFSKDIQDILQESCNLQRKCEQLFLNQGSVLYRSDSLSTVSRGHTLSDYDRRTYTSMSSLDSFVSAQAEIADLSDFDDHLELDLQQYAMYQMALNQLEEQGGIPYRSLRTETVNCASDRDYLAKIHCLRLGFQHLFKDKSARKWFADIGREVISNLVVKAEKDPKDFLIAFDEMIEFMQEASNHSKSFEELQTRGVKFMGFFDIVLDYIVLDGFEDIQNPPSPVKAVIQNRWLSVSFKETALATAVWSVLKAKRRNLLYPDGFISHFYDISEHITPVLAWGFLGPDEELREICTVFKDEMLHFIEDIFDMKKVRFTTVNELSIDLFNQAQLHFETVNQMISL
ncbi:Mitoguardin [Nymphon striatum]|nr:Mitoguardin [Nymphon striatum]